MIDCGQERAAAGSGGASRKRVGVVAWLTMVILAVAVGVASMPQQAHATLLSWTNTGTTDFNDGANWGGAAPGVGDNANFDATTPSVQPQLTAGVTIQGVTFTTATGGWTLSTANSSVLTLSNTGTGASGAINAVNTSGTNTISTAIVLDGAAASTATITQARAGTLVLSGNISSTNAIAGVSFVAGAGATNAVFTLSGNNTYQGNTTVQANQTININSATAISAGTLIFGSGATLDNTSGTANLVLTNNNNINLSGGSLTYTGTSGNSLSFGSGTLTASVANRTATISAGTFTIGSFNTDTTTRTITKAGGGTMVVTGAAGANFQGGLTISGGTLIIGNRAAMGSGTVSMTGAALQGSSAFTGANNLTNNFLLTGTGTFSGSNSLEIAGKLTGNTGGSRTLTSSIAGGTLTLGNVDISNDTSVLRNLTIGGTGLTTINGTIANGTGTATANTVSVTNTSTTTLNGPNTFTGGLTLNAGAAILVLGNTTALGTANFTATTGNLQSNTDLSGANKLANTMTLSALTVNGSNNLEFGGKVTGNTGGSRTLNSAITGGNTLILNAVDISNDTTTVRTFTIASTGNTTINGTIANGTGTTTNNILSVTNTGTTSILGNNTFTGQLSITTNGGTVILGGSQQTSGVLLNQANAKLALASDTALGSNQFSFQTGELSASGGARTIANNILFFNAANTSIAGSQPLTLNGTMNWNGSQIITVNNTAMTTFGGTFILRSATDTTAQRTLNIAGTGNLRFNGQIVNGSSTNGIVALNGTGTYELNANNTFSGPLTIGTGTTATTAKLGHANGIGFGGAAAQVAGNTTVSAGATLDLNGQNNVNEVIVLNGNGVGGNGALINSNTSTPATIGSGVSYVVITNGGTGYSAAPALTVNGATGATANALLGLTAASLGFNANGSTYSVAPTISITGGGATVNATASVTTAGALNFGTAGVGYTSAPTVTILTPGTLLTGTGVTFTPTGTDFSVVALQMTNAGSGAVLPTVSFDSGAAAATAGQSGIALNGITGNAIGGAGDIVVNGLITGAVNQSLSKIGGGTLTLTNNNTYLGGTTISGGKVLVNNTHVNPADSGTGGGAVTVTAGTLGGTGWITGAVSVADSAHLAPGASVGTLNTGALTLSNGSLLDFELAAPGSGDMVAVTGDLTLDGVLNITNAGGLAEGSYQIFSYTGNLTNNVLTAPASGFMGFDWAVDTNTANAVFLNVSAVPEPASVSLITLAAAGLLMRKRRRSM